MLFDFKICLPRIVYTVQYAGRHRSNFDFLLLQQTRWSCRLSWPVRFLEGRVATFSTTGCTLSKRIPAQQVEKTKSQSCL